MRVRVEAAVVSYSTQIVVAGKYQRNNLHQETYGCRGGHSPLDLAVGNPIEDGLLGRAGEGGDRADTKAKCHDGPDIKVIEFNTGGK